MTRLGHCSRGKSSDDFAIVVADQASPRDNSSLTANGLMDLSPIEFLALSAEGSPMLTFACPSCRQVMSVTPYFAGKVVDCPHCGLQIQAPESAAPRAPSSPLLTSPPPLSGPVLSRPQRPPALPAAPGKKSPILLALVVFGVMTLVAASVTAGLLFWADSLGFTSGGDTGEETKTAEEKEPASKDDKGQQEEKPGTTDQATQPSAEEVAAARRDQYIKDLRAADAQVRAHAAERLGRLGAEGRLAVPALLLALQDEDDMVRRLAQIALTQIGPPLPADLGVLVAALNSDQPLPARVYATTALAALGMEAKPATGALVKALRDSDAGVRKSAAFALGKIGPSARDASYKTLLDALRDADREVRLAAAGTLTGFGAPTPTDQGPLVALLEEKGSTHEARRYAAWGLGMIGPPAREKAFRPLLDLLQDDDQEVRAVAFDALAKLGPATPADRPPLARALGNRAGKVEARLYTAGALGDLDAQALPALCEAVRQDSETKVVAAAMASLAKIGPQTREVGQTLARALDHKEQAIALQAMQVLGKFGMQSSTLDGFLKGLDSKDEKVRGLALQAMPKVGFLTKDAVTNLGLGPENVLALRATLGSPNAPTRGLSAFGLATLGREARPAVPELRLALRDPDGSVRAEAMNALAVIGPDAREAQPDLIAVIQNRAEPPRLHVCAALALAVIGDEAGVKAALPVLVGALKVESPMDEVGLALARNAGEVLVKNGKPAAELLYKALDGDFAEYKQVTLAKRNARLWAVQILTRMGQAANGPGRLQFLAQIENQYRLDQELKQAIAATRVRLQRKD